MIMELISSDKVAANLKLHIASMGWDLGYENLSLPIIDNKLIIASKVISNWLYTFPSKKKVAIYNEWSGKAT